MQSVEKLSSTELAPGAKKVGAAVPEHQGLWLEHILGGQNSTHNRVLHRLNFLDHGHYHIFLVRPRCGGWVGFWVPLQGAFCWHFLSADISFLLSAGFPFCWHFTAPFLVPAQCLSHLLPHLPMSPRSDAEPMTHLPCIWVPTQPPWVSPEEI